MIRGAVVGLHLVRAHGERPQFVSQATATVGRGLDGDLHGKTRKPGSGRQALIVDRADLARVGLQPGDLREQITVDLPDLNALPIGTLLRIGLVTFELTGPCEPCTHIGGLIGIDDPQTFQETLIGRRGQLARVTATEGDGTIRVGDPVVPQGVATPAVHEQSL
jgi:MOSC domain-containing protein YiiM